MCKDCVIFYVETETLVETRNIVDLLSLQCAFSVGGSLSTETQPYSINE